MSCYTITDTTCIQIPKLLDTLYSNVLHGRSTWAIVTNHFWSSSPQNGRRPVAAHLIRISRRTKALVRFAIGKLHAKWIPMCILHPGNETGYINAIICMNVPFETQILQRCARFCFGEPFCNICAGESPRNEVDAYWFRFVQNLSLNPVFHHINQDAFHVHDLPISVGGKLKEISSYSVKMLIKCHVLTRLPDNADI